MMKILILAPYPPYPPRGGGALRIYNLIGGLAERHAITCLSFAPSPAAAEALAPLAERCRLITVLGPPPRSLGRRALTTLASPLPDMAHRNASAAYQAALDELLARERFDIVQAESIEMAQFGLRRAGGARPLTVLDEFNAEYLLQRRAALNDLRRPSSAKRLAGGLYSLAQWAKLAAYERRMLRAYDRVLVVSRDDRAALQRLWPAADPAIIPNGVDTNYFAPMEQPQAASRQKAIVFTGTLDYRPNIDAALWFAREVLPLIRAVRPEAKLLLVGRSPAPAVRALHDGQAIELLGEVPDVRPAIGGAAAYVVPMRIGGGVRLKLLEALAMAAPVASTTMGAEGVDELRDGGQLLLADTPAAFAAAVLRLIDEPQLAARLGQAGRALACAHYDWRAIVPRLEAVYTLASAGASP
jgi:polysaccharide biosynthesis protein PslH